MGKIDDAIREIEKSQILYQLSPICGRLAIWFYLIDGRYDKTIDQFHKTVEINPEFLQAYMWAGEVYTLTNEYEKDISATWFFSVALMPL